MDDLDLDRELRAALDVAPSPEFVARVRGAIAERPHTPLMPRWLMPAAAVACAVIAVVLYGVRSQNDSVDVRVEPATVETTRSLPSTPHTYDRGQVLTGPVVIQTVRRQSPIAEGTASTTPDLPEVLISAADKRAFEDFVATVQQHRFAATFEDVPESTPWVVSELALAPLTIEPLDPEMPNTSIAYN